MTDAVTKLSDRGCETRSEPGPGRRTCAVEPHPEVAGFGRRMVQAERPALAERLDVAELSSDGTRGSGASSASSGRRAAIAA